MADKQHRSNASAAAGVSTLRYRKRALWLIALYVPLLLVPWSLICTLNYHPVNLSSYYGQNGISTNSLTLHRRLMSAIAVINSFTSIITIPLISALIAQAAVVYTQRSRKTQSVSVRQTFALADRGWSNLSILSKAWPPWRTARSKSTNSGSGFLWLAAAFLLVCAITVPIREGFMSTHSILIMSSQDNIVVRSNSRPTYSLIGHDAEPYDMATIPEDIVVQDVMNNLAAIGRSEIPSHLWPDYGGFNPFRPTQFLLGKQYGPWRRLPTDYFVAALPNGTTTGVLRHRLMRMNSTVTGREIDQSTFEASCAGEQGFSTSFVRTGQFEVRLCVPSPRRMPWGISRNRQRISEDLLIDVQNFTLASQNGSSANYSRHYTVQTSRGYFELGNYRNDFIQGPLLERWDEPDPYAQSSEYNDWMSEIWRDNNTFTDILRILRGRYRRASAEDELTDIPKWPEPQFLQSPWPRVPGSSEANRTAGGPLMISALAMFGERSLFALANTSNETTAPTIAAQICETGRMPFSALTEYQMFAEECATARSSEGTNNEELITAVMSKFVRRMFNDTSMARTYLGAGAFFANRAMLLQTVEKTSDFSARPIHNGIGEYIQKPSLSLGGLILVSVLVLLQLLGLIYLTWYIYQIPTWTAMLDAMAVARITNSLEKEDIPAIGSISAHHLQRLSSIDGMVGVVHARKDVEDGEVPGQGPEVELGLGAPGLFHRRLAKFRMKDATSTLQDMDEDCRCEGCRRRRAAIETDSQASSS